MISTAMHIKIVENVDDMNISYKLRDIVFTQEQNVPAQEDFDGLDEIATHFLLFENETPIGNARVYSDNQAAVIGRFCILKDYRKSGAGRFLLQEVLKYCKRQNFEKIILGAQEHAIGFYAKFGFEVCSDMYIDGNIPHFKMQLK